MTEISEDEILADLRARGIAREIPEYDTAGNICKNPDCDEIVPENSHKTLNLGLSGGCCSVACLMEWEDIKQDYRENNE